MSSTSSTQLIQAVKLFTLALTTSLVTASALQAQIALVSSSVIERQAKPGEHFEGTLLIRNASRAPQEARIYQTAYAFFADGRTNYGAPGSLARSNASWVRFSPDHVVVPAGATVPVSYSVSVPTADSLRGSYWSVLMVEGVPAADADASRPKAERPSLGLVMLTRYATQISTTVGSGEPKIAFDSVVTSSPNGGRGLRFDVLNTGDVAMRLRMSVELYSEAGALVATAEQQRGLVYPGMSFRQTFDFGQLPSGAYRAVVSADAGLEELFGSQFRIRY
jgi:hypothetical protein